MYKQTYLYNKSVHVLVHIPLKSNFVNILIGLLHYENKT